ncbi:hypothetical protein T02_13533 [Trichinella nativa]|uniref:Uncharacterized protein n=1 Tax=Trichinella nativa TaxID=6335 RepID=A0A0V1LVP4_9BILA|nr:hypothetical protein T02_13533 [Trichinella nativa]
MRTNCNANDPVVVEYMAFEVGILPTLLNTTCISRELCSQERREDVRSTPESVSDLLMPIKSIFGEKCFS